jgi:hypothetical protein
VSILGGGGEEEAIKIEGKWWPSQRMIIDTGDGGNDTIPFE